jgi:hypothetical protein
MAIPDLRSQLWLFPADVVEVSAAIDSLTEERWIEIEGFPGYECSTNGRFRNVRNGRFLRGTLARTGYVHVGFLREGKHHVLPAHRLVAKAFLGTPQTPGDWVVDHINRRRTDNRLANLEWVTRSENARRYIAIRKGERLGAEPVPQSSRAIGIPNDWNNVPPQAERHEERQRTGESDQQTMPPTLGVRVGSLLLPPGGQEVWRQP